VPANIAGLPAISVPSGKDKNNLPIGIQFLSSRLNDDILLKFAYYFEKKISK
jgi:aspartyl-tRNA(Asn)/glutamyl-tRNA(Gln) amidotransferase subunit A